MLVELTYVIGKNDTDFIKTFTLDKMEHKVDFYWTVAGLNLMISLDKGPNQDKISQADLMLNSRYWEIRLILTFHIYIYIY